MTSPAACIETTDLVLPEHANHYGTLFGGRALERMATAAFLAARAGAGRNVVLAGVSAAEFLAPVPAGHALRLRAWVSRVGRSSLTVCVNGLAEAPGVPLELVLRGVFEMVAVDAHGRPAPIDSTPLKQETP